MNCVHDLKEHGKDCEIRQSERESNDKDELRFLSGVLYMLRGYSCGKHKELEKTILNRVYEILNRVYEIRKRGEGKA